jgi:hypothetical protein
MPVKMEKLLHQAIKKILSKSLLSGLFIIISPKEVDLRGSQAAVLR